MDLETMEKRRAESGEYGRSYTKKRKACPFRTPKPRAVNVIRPGHRDGAGQDTLNRNLGRMQLSRLLVLPWDVGAESLVEDLLGNKPVVRSPIRANISAWTEEVILNTYHLPRNATASGMCEGTDELRSYAETFFEQGRVRKNGWRLEQCLDAVNLRPVFAFLTPILNPDAETRITLSLAITVIASFSGKKQINWASILRDVVLKEATKLRKKNYTHITPYISHIYHAHGCLTETEKRILLKGFPEPYGFITPRQQESCRTRAFAIQPSDPSSIDVVSNSKLLGEVLEILGCSRGEALDKVKRLKSEDLSQSPLHSSFTPPHRSPLHEFASDSTCPSCSFEPDDTYNPTSPPSDSRGDYVNHLGIVDDAIEEINEEVRESDTCPACHSRRTLTRNLGNLNVHQELTRLNCEVEEQQQRNEELNARTNRQAGEIQIFSTAQAQLDCDLKSLQKEHSDSTAEVGQLRKEIEASTKEWSELSEAAGKANERLRLQLNELTGKIEGCKKQSEQRTQEVESLRAVMAISESKSQTLREENAKVSAEVQQLRMQRAKSPERESEALGDVAPKTIPQMPLQRVAPTNAAKDLVGGKWQVPDYCYSQRKTPKKEPRTRIDDSELKGKTKIPANMTCGVDLYEHQAKGVHWMLSMETHDGTANPKGGILADDQGLGKTIQLIGLMLLHRFKLSPTLIICPASVLFQWEQEILEKVSGSYRLNVLVYHGPGRDKKLQNYLTWDVVITTYDLARQPGNPLQQWKWHRIILDECQNIKNEKGCAAIEICKFEAQFRWCVSGTVLSNNYTELYSYFTFLRYRPLGGQSAESKKHRAEMRRKADQGSHKRYQEIYAEMHAHLLKMTLRRLKGVLVLPKKIYITKEVDFSRQEDKALYSVYSESLEQEIKKKKGKPAQIISLMMKLQQVCLHRALCLKKSDDVTERKEMGRISAKVHFECVHTLADWDENGECTHCQGPWVLRPPFCVSACGHAFCEKCSLEVRDAKRARLKCDTCQKVLAWGNMYSLWDLLPPGQGEVVVDERLLGFDVPDNIGGPKFEAIMDYLRALPVIGKDDSGKIITEKALIFCHWPSAFPYLQKHLDSDGVEYRIVEGETPLETRRRNLEEFKTIPRVKVMLLSLHAANSGLNIVAANHVLMINHWWNPASEDQAVDRAHRLGQTKDVQVVRFVVRKTIECSVLRRQEFKRSMARGCLYGRTDLPSCNEPYEMPLRDEVIKLFDDYTSEVTL